MPIFLGKPEERDIAYGDVEESVIYVKTNRRDLIDACEEVAKLTRKENIKDKIYVKFDFG